MLPSLIINKQIINCFCIYTNNEYSKIEEEYLDHLIKLAFDLDDLEKEQQILEEAENSDSGPDEETLRRIWQAAQEKMDRLQP